MPPTSPYVTGDRRRDAVLEFVAEFWETHGYGPSMREIATGIGITHPSGAAYHVRILIEGGCLSRIEGIARSIRVIEVEA